MTRLTPLPPVDADQPSTWPPELTSLARKHLGASSDTFARAEQSFRLLVAERGLLAFHCTRLLDHERDAIRSGGLLRLDAELVRSRIAAAAAHGSITAAERERATAANMYTVDQTNTLKWREGEICLVVGRSVFEDDPGGIEPFLTEWGGEAIRGGPDPEDVLRCGTPAIIVATVRPGRGELMFPDLGPLLAVRLGADGYSFSELHLRSADVPGEDILDIWQPGHPEYDRHEQLPRS